MFLSVLWRWRTILDYMMPNSPDTLQVLLTGFAFMGWSMTLESMVLGLPDFTWSLRFLQPEKILWIICLLYWNLLCLHLSYNNIFSCLNFWDETWWFLSLRVFRLLSSSLLLFPQGFGRYVSWPSSSVCWTLEPSWNFELCPLLNPRGSPVLVLLAVTGYKC